LVRTDKNLHVGLNMFIEDKPVNKFDLFTTEAMVYKCVNDKLFLHNKYFHSNDDIDQFVGYVFHEIGLNGQAPEDSFKRSALWSTIKSAIKKGTDYNRQLCIDHWYNAARSKVFILLLFEL